jgi:hypothetical protein
VLQAHDGPTLRGALAGPHVTAVVALLRDTVRAHGAPLLLIAGSAARRCSTSPTCGSASAPLP